MEAPGDGLLTIMVGSLLYLLYSQFFNFSFFWGSYGKSIFSEVSFFRAQFGEETDSLKMFCKWSTLKKFMWNETEVQGISFILLFHFGLLDFDVYM